MKAAKVYISDDGYTFLAKSISGKYFIKIRYCNPYYGMVYTKWQECNIKNIYRKELEWDDRDGNHHKVKKTYVEYNYDDKPALATILLLDTIANRNSRVRLPY